MRKRGTVGNREKEKMRETRIVGMKEDIRGKSNNAIMDVDDECDGIGKLMIYKTCKIFRSRLKQ